MSEPAGVQSLDRAFGLMEILSMHPGGMPLQAVAGESGLHKSTAHRLLASLIALGYVKKSDADGRYQLSFKLFEMAARVVENIDVLEVARGTLERLRDASGEAVHLVVRDGSDIVYVHKSENPGAYQMFSRIGMRRPLYCTAAGKAILATLSDREVAKIWGASEIIPYTAHTLVGLEPLYRDLDDTRERGYALDNEENELGVRCIGAAVRDFTGQSRAAFSISAPVSRMTDDRVRELAPLVLESAGCISAALGYRGGNSR